MNSFETRGQPHLAKQAIDKMNTLLLTPLTPEVISRQATINIGTIGHVAHGKSTVVKCFSGIETGRYTRERQRNMTIKLGYANAKIFACDNIKCPRPGRYRSTGSNKADVFPCDRPACGGQFRIVRHISFVDCPGHDTFMAAMLNGAAIMDAALLIIAANEVCPQPQTSEHLAAINVSKLKTLLILQNKIDLVGKAQVKKQYKDINDFIQGTNAEGAPVIPICAQRKCNIDVVLDYIVNIPVPIRDFTSKPKMIIIRSFDVNKPGTDVEHLQGGVAGGSILKGVLKVSQEIEIRPGIIRKDNAGLFHCRPIISQIVSLYAEQNELAFAVPGGLVGVGTKIDPTLCRSDRLVGQVLGEVGALPEIYTEIEVVYSLLQRVVGVRTEGGQKCDTIAKLSKTELLMINIGSLSTGGRVLGTRDNLAKIQLTVPVCAEPSEKIALSRRINGSYRLIGWGEIRKGKVLQTQE